MRHIYSKENVADYIKSKSNSWSRSTLHSEWARLRGALGLLNEVSGAPFPFFEKASKRYKPYAVKTLFIRIGEFIEFTQPELKPNPFKAFMKENALLFKNAYVPKTLDVTFTEAVAQVASMETSAAKEMAVYLQNTGLRSIEALEGYDPETNTVMGKGGRRRKVVTAKEGLECPEVKPTYSRLYKALKSQTSLTPHMLRKLFATELVNLGLGEADLMKVMGWTNMQTASIYLQPKRLDALQGVIRNGFKSK